MKQIFHILTGASVRGQLWKRAWFASGLIVLVAVVGNTHLNRILPQSGDDALAMAFEQRVTTQQVVKAALKLDAAVRGEQYDQIPSAMEMLEQSASTWEQTHQQLMAFSLKGIDEPIARLVNPHVQIDRGLDELLLVGKSAQRRAPYLDSETVNRITRAAVVVGMYEDQYNQGLTQITALRRQIVDARIEDFRSSSRAVLWVLVVLVVCSTPIVVFPALGAMEPKSGKGADSADSDAPDPLPIGAEPSPGSAQTTTRKAA